MSCGRITKLNVNIERGQTHRTYANRSTRIVVNNPSGHVFRNTGVAGIRSSGDAASQARKFLQRHFGQNGSLRQTPSMCELLERLPVKVNEFEDLQPEQPKLIYTLDQLELPTSETKRATIRERSTAQFELVDLPWHLQTCIWQDLKVSKLEKAKCYCLEIKETMEHAEKLIKSAETSEEQTVKRKKQSKAKTKTKPKKTQLKENINCHLDINVDIQNLNVCLQKLNSLLEKQNQSQGLE